MKENQNIVSSKKPFFTVFIGLYNSEKVIHRFFESFKSQTFRDFELIIVDDCSQDDTVRIIKEFLSKINDVNFIFEQNKTNKGVGFGRRRALELANGEFFVKWDHDDIQDPNQLQVFIDAYRKYKDFNIASVWCLCKDMKGNILGNEYPKKYTIGTYLSMYTKYILSTVNNPRERHNCISVKVHKEIYEYAQKNKMKPQGVSITATDLWSILAILGYKTVYVNKPLRQYFIENNRARMSNSGRKNNAESVFYDRVNWINDYMKLLPITDVVWRIRLFLSINQYAEMSGKSISHTLKEVKAFHHKFLIILFYLPVKAFLTLSGRNK